MADWSLASLEDLGGRFVMSDEFRRQRMQIPTMSALDRVRVIVDEYQRDLAPLPPTWQRANPGGRLLGYPFFVTRSETSPTPIMVDWHDERQPHKSGEPAIVISHREFREIQDEHFVPHTATANGMLTGMASVVADDERRQEIQPFMDFGGWQLCFDDEMQHMAFYVDRAAMRTYIAPSTWETLSYDEKATEQFLEDMQQGAGMKRLVTDAGKYRDAALAEAKAKGTDQPARKDLLIQLGEEAQGLLMQAASLNQAPTTTQLQAFVHRLSELRARFTETEAKLEELRGLIDLAETAVVDAMEDA